MSPDNPAAERASFALLPVDLKTLIVSHVIRPTDMRNLCLTCKQLHEITVRQLYHEVSLDLGCTNDNRLSAFLHPRNIGLPYVRMLDVYLADVVDKYNQADVERQLQQANFAIRMILEFLPENILERFCWHPWSEFSADNLVLLYTKQKKLKWLEGFALDRDVLPDLEDGPLFDTIFERARKLGLYPDSREVLDFCGLLLRRTKNPEKVTIHANFSETDPLLPMRELYDSSTQPGLITTSIFGHMQPFDKCVPLALKDLTLQKVGLRYAANTYCRIVDFRQLRYLRVFSCPGADALFAEISKSTRLPEKLECLEFKGEDNVENDTLEAIDGLLCLVSGITSLTLDIMSAKKPPAVAGISRQGRTLKELNVHASPGSSVDDRTEEHIYDANSFLQICKDCPQLEQLSVAFPSTSLIRAISEEFTVFEAALGDLPNLVTLNITTWPTNLPSTTRLPRKIYEHLLQNLAQHGFDLSTAHAREFGRSSKLSVIAFGCSDKIYDREDPKTQIIFVKGTQRAPFEEERPLATQVGWCLRKYVEPRSSILDFSLSRSHRPPTKDQPPDDLD
ncbi:hypothetical protein BDY21DRAFT_385840 [Lineolata rhizophorae]|uniref:Uncharacterized protein n=1 Tax=Lineolata rhizophorae TaxID=578093 RepID=A0A6A6P134_9PEZI|nr:hypothetical protein BDY21DRAFT_385840 [Lineolata rhizophorae]